ncbi:MAG TPA: response regulator transcription factor [Candidatus Binatia bacterium]|jgi:two-component system, NarL family, invasion response regulator UvrY|nr:response regulator transcription factor [Candidatus Binatia bacterium]
MRILIADDHPIFRAGLKEILIKQPDTESVGEAEDGLKALALARKERWDLILLDITMPGKDGLEVLQELRRERPKLPILILSAHPEDQMALRLLKAGAAGYLTKDRAPEVLLTAIRKILAGEKYISESLAEKTVLRVISESPGLLHETLSDREYQVMRMIASGKTIQEIGEALFLSARTVSTYRARLLEKMNMKSNTELLRYALEHKLVE